MILLISAKGTEFLLKMMTKSAWLVLLKGNVEAGRKDSVITCFKKKQTRIEEALFYSDA